MFETLGIELYQLFSFSKQLGLALAGASCLWGFLAMRAIGKKQDLSDVESAEKKASLEWAANRLFLSFSFGFTLAATSWFVLWNIWPALAHEGITLYPDNAEYKRAFLATLPIYIAWIVLTVGAFLLRFRRKDAFKKLLPRFYASQFLIIAFLISMYAWTGDAFSKEQLYYYFHGFHSMFTLGTVLVLDFLFLSSRLSISLQRHIFPFFPAVSKIIFIGLGLDFLSVYLVFDDALILSTRFFMAQTVVGILIINGAILAGPMTRNILEGLRKGRALSGKWKIASGVCGPISIISWTTITFIDFLPNLALSYVQLLAIYAAAISLGAVVKLLVIDKLDARKALEAQGTSSL